jgi:hypothetical protein
MTDWGRGHGDVFEGKHIGECTPARVPVAVGLRCAISQASTTLVKAEHAFYVAAVDDLFVRGTPFRLDYSRSSARLPVLTPSDSCPPVPAIPKLVWTRFHGASSPQTLTAYPRGRNRT